MILRCVLMVDWPWALSLDEDIYNARDSCTSHATENIDYLTNIKPYNPATYNFYNIHHRTLEDSNT